MKTKTKPKQQQQQQQQQIVSIGNHPIYSLARLSWFESSPLVFYS